MNNLTNFSDNPERIAKLKAYGDALRAEKRRREAKKDGHNPWGRFLGDPQAFVEDALREHLIAKQREICNAIIAHDRVAVKSCHESGKSFISARLACWWIAAHDPHSAFVVTSAPTFPQVRIILWREINRAHARGRLPGYCNQTEWILDKQVVALGRKPEDAAASAFQGVHARNMLVIFDEACGMPSNLWVAAETLIANEGAKMLAIGNPDDPATEFGNICKPGSGWHVITISAFDTPNLSGEWAPHEVRASLVSKSWVYDKKKRWGETSPLYQSKILGEFPESNEDALIAPRHVAAAVGRELSDAGPSVLGIDVARFGRNETVIYHRQGLRARLQAVARKQDLMQTCGMVVRAIKDTRAHRIIIDDIGLGGGVTDRLREIKREGQLGGVEIIPGNVGVTYAPSTSEGERFFNVRARLCWELRERFVAGEIDLDDDLDTQAQLCAIQYHYTSRGQILIESKEEVEERLNKMEGVTGQSGSPDRFDALVLAFAEFNKAQSAFFEVGRLRYEQALLIKQNQPKEGVKLVYAPGSMEYEASLRANQT